MRRLTPGLLVSLSALVAALLPVVPFAPINAVGTVAAASAPKVAIIVGPAGGNTAGYKADADAIAAEARLYTPNVAQVYTPNATWAAAKAALQGATIVVYMGHGNGFPSPYSTSPRPATQNGLGLNPVAGVNDSTTQYFGETSIASEIRLAPNAVVLLVHLCYASGNSEPGKAEPTLAMAELRADNYAAGFLAAGARAVIATAYYGGSQYMDTLFTTDLTMDQLWQAGPGANPNVISYPSTRTPGMTAELNPDAATGKYWRSIVGRLDLRASQVTGGAGGVGGVVGVTPAVPARIAVPGTAAVATSGAALFGNASLTADPATGQPLAWLPAGTALRIDAAVAQAPDGSLVYAAALPDSSLSGYVAGSALVPGPAGDTAPPVLSVPSAGSAAVTTISPNGDGVADHLRLPYTMSEAGWIELSVVAASGAAVRTRSVVAPAGTGTLDWDGRADGGTIVPDGTYTLTVTPHDQAGNVGGASSKAIAVFAALSSVSTAVPVFFPQAPDGAPATATLGFVLSSPATVTWTITDAAGHRVLTHLAAQPLGPGGYAFEWDGRDQGGAIVPRGTYYSVVRASNGGLVFATRVAFVADAFAVRVSDSTPSRGQTITVTINAARPLVAPPTLTIIQANKAPRTVSVAAVAGGYRVRVRLVSGSANGTLRIVVSGQDVTGLTSSSTASYPLG